MNRLISVLIIFLLVVPCSAKWITVDDDGPADHGTIQAAIDSSWDGDTIIVKQGTYREQVIFNGRRVTVRSENPDDSAVVQATVIMYASGSSVIFDFNEGNDSGLKGFTITGHGVFCAGASPTLSRNVIRDCDGTGIKGQNNAAPAIVGNAILSNDAEGIYGCDGPIVGNTISGNSAGIAFCSGAIHDNLISENGNASGLYYCDGDISGNVIVANRGAPHGGGLYECDAQIHNNVIAGNRADQDGGGLYRCTGTICNNTIVGNRAGTNGGGLGQCSGTVCNNIIAFNEAEVAGGIFGVCANTYNAFWMNAGGNFGGGATTGQGEIVTDPLFAQNGAWQDGGTPETDDDVWINGDYHLWSQAGRLDEQAGRWEVDGDTSHCVDAGDPSASWWTELWPHGKRINIGAYGGTTQASLSLSDVGHQADLDNDGHVGPRDLKILSMQWLSAEAWQTGDLDRNGAVDFNDFAVLAQHWRAGPPPPTPPTPSPMTFATRPYATGPYSIAMVATAATSTDGTGVEYLFEDFFNPEFNSGWLAFAPGAEPRWEDTGLTPETTYWYRVQARNRGNLLATEWSVRFGDETPREDSAAPTPNPMTWETEPYASAANAIRMVATNASDDSGVEYQFECTSHPIYSSGWQDSRIYEVTSLPGSHYTFKLRARDKSVKQNVTLASVAVAVDLQPPSPNPMQWELEPKEILVTQGSLGYGATMTAVEAVDESTDVEYFFECTTQSGFSSGWQTSREYTVLLGRKGQGHRFRVKARDVSSSHNETRPSSELPAL